MRPSFNRTAACSIFNRFTSHVDLLLIWQAWKHIKCHRQQNFGMIETNSTMTISKNHQRLMPDRKQWLQAPLGIAGCFLEFQAYPL